VGDEPPLLSPIVAADAALNFCGLLLQSVAMLALRGLVFVGGALGAELVQTSWSKFKDPYGTIFLSIPTVSTFRFQQ